MKFERENGKFPRENRSEWKERKKLKEKMVDFKRTKTKLRNNLSPTALETVVKFSILEPVITDK